MKLISKIIYIFLSSQMNDKQKMKIAIFSAVPEEVWRLWDLVNFTGIGKINATKNIHNFMNRHKNEDFTIINLGTVWSHRHKVWTILSINEIITAGKMFVESPLLLDHFEINHDFHPVINATLYSSDCFISPDVFTEWYLNSIKEKSDCFDMESAALYMVAKHNKKNYISYKIVSDNLDIPFSVREERVWDIAKQFAVFVDKLMDKLHETYDIDFLK